MQTKICIALIYCRTIYLSLKEHICAWNPWKYQIAENLKMQQSQKRLKELKLVSAKFIFIPHNFHWAHLTTASRKHKWVYLCRVLVDARIFWWLYCAVCPGPTFCFTKVTSESIWCCLEQELLWRRFPKKSMGSFNPEHMKFLKKNGNIKGDRINLQPRRWTASPS